MRTRHGSQYSLPDPPREDVSVSVVNEASSEQPKPVAVSPTTQTESMLPIVSPEQPDLTQPSILLRFPPDIRLNIWEHVFSDVLITDQNVEELTHILRITNPDKSGPYRPRITDTSAKHDMRSASKHRQGTLPLLPVTQVCRATRAETMLPSLYLPCVTLCFRSLLILDGLTTWRRQHIALLRRMFVRIGFVTLSDNPTCRHSVIQMLDELKGLQLDELVINTFGEPQHYRVYNVFDWLIRYGKGFKTLAMVTDNEGWLLTTPSIKWPYSCPAQPDSWRSILQQRDGRKGTSVHMWQEAKHNSGHTVLDRCDWEKIGTAGSGWLEGEMGYRTISDKHLAGLFQSFYDWVSIPRGFEKLPRDRRMVVLVKRGKNTRVVLE